MSKETRRLLPALAFVAVAGFAAADEGMWLFTNPPAKELRERYGFTPTPEWLAHLQRSCVRFSTGGSGSIISPDGLVLTNHHVAADVLYKLSTQEHDYLKDGFYAATRGEEVRCPDLELVCLWEVEDVTERVKGAARPGAAAAEAETARRREISAIEKESFDATGLKSDVVTLYQGGRYHLYKYKRFTDLRLVFAPEKDIAFFGGDPDNFEYPRYDLDCCFFRIWENDAPLRAEYSLRWSTEGCRDGELVFVAGHPGRTERLFTAEHVEFLRDVRFPSVLRRLWRSEVKLSNFSDRGEEERRIAEDELFGIQNSRKAYTGMLAGALDPAFIAAKRAYDRNLKAAVDANPEYASRWGDAWAQIASAQKTAADTYERNVLLNLALRSDLLGIARHLVRLADERPKVSAERLPEYNDAQLPSLEFRLFSPAPIYDSLEIERLESGLTLMAEIAGGDDPLVRTAFGGKAPRARAEELVHGSVLKDVAARRALYEGGAAAVEASRDPLIALARALDPEARALRKRIEDEVDGVLREGYDKIAAARFAIEGESVYPDATFTLRLSYGEVKGYEEDGRRIAPFTDIAGLYERSAAHGNTYPYEIPQSWAERKDELDLSTPMNFVSTCDIIGGNSGSPTVNAQNEVVGLVFDGNIQSLIGNLAYTDEQARAVSVDARAILAALRDVYGASELVRELVGPAGG